MNDIVVIFGLQDPNVIDRDIDGIAEKHNQYEYARRLIQSVTASKGGRIIGQLQGNEIVTLPIDQVGTVREIHQRLNDEARCPCAVGVGEDAHQALEALEYANEHAPDTIKVYDFNVNVDHDSKPEEMQKSEKYVPISEEQKTKVAQILQEVNNNRDFFNQLQAESPDIYATVVSVVQSLTSILQSDKEAQEKYVAKMIQKINDQLERHTGKRHGKVAKEIQKEIDRHHKSTEKDQRENFSKWFSSKVEGK